MGGGYVHVSTGASEGQKRVSSPAAGVKWL